jgi:FLVCR family MFS transporter 7
VNTPLWKISNGKNGEKYLTFSGATTSSRANSNASRGRNNTDEDDDEGGEYADGSRIKQYKLRWYILAVISLANISNAINWISYSPIADFTGRFYSVSYTLVHLLSLSFLIVSIPAGFFSFWITDNFGIRTSISLGVWFNLIGSAVKVLSSIDTASGEPFVSESNKYACLLTGQCLCALAQPFIMFVTTKFANTWFSDTQRALANTLALGSNTLGILIGSFMSAQIVNSSVTFVSEMCLLNLICLVAALVPTLMSCFITRSTPKLPPSYSAIIQSSSNQPSAILGEEETPRSSFRIYLDQVGNLLKSKDFLILMFSFGTSLGLFNALTTLIEQILCVRGYTDIDVGYFGGAMIVSGIVGSILAGAALDRTKKFEEIAKVCFGMSALAGIGFSIIQLYDNDKSTVYFILLGSFSVLGFFGLPLLPVCMEMSIECVYPIPEATSTGLLFIGGQVVGIAMILAYPKTATQLPPDSYVYNNVQTCTTGNKTTTTSSLVVLDYTYEVYFQTLLQVAVAIIFIIFFKCAYLRLRSEREKRAEKILNSSSN